MSRQHKIAVSEDLVWLALDQLKKDNLLSNGEQIETKFTGVSRREVIRKIGFASMIALPVLSSIVAPQAAHAQSDSAVAVRCRMGTSTPPFFCYNANCMVGSCSGNSCANTLEDAPSTACCSGTQYGVRTSDPGVTVFYYCR